MTAIRDPQNEKSLRHRPDCPEGMFSEIVLWSGDRAQMRMAHPEPRYGPAISGRSPAEVGRKPPQSGMLGRPGRLLVAGARLRRLLRFGLWWGGRVYLFL